MHALANAMPEELLLALKERLDEELDGLSLTGDGLEAIADARYGEVTIQIEHDLEVDSVRVMVAVPVPAGSGLQFLVWCLASNTSYWDVKIGLDEEGHLVVHADLDADGADRELLASRIVDRVETILELLDDDLAEWLLAHDLGTPRQRERWKSRTPPTGD